MAEVEESFEEETTMVRRKTVKSSFKIEEVSTSPITEIVQIFFSSTYTRNSQAKLKSQREIKKSREINIFVNAFSSFESILTKIYTKKPSERLKIAGETKKNYI